MIKLSLKYGSYNLFTAYAYANYSYILAGIIGEIEIGYKFAKLALSLIGKFKTAKTSQSKVYGPVLSAMSMKKHLKELIPIGVIGYQKGLEVGDLEHAFFSAYAYCHLLLLLGRELTWLEQEITKYIEILQQHKLDRHTNMLKLLKAVVY